jgi:16S rRNA (cytosine967-C5)-methyltransferase
VALDARATAAKILGRVIAGKSLNQAMPKLLGEAPERDQALVQQLCYGSLRQYPRLKAVLGQLLDKPLRGKDSDVFALMIIGLYQLDALRVPDHAAVAATVEATRGLGKPWAKGLTNAILRRFLREREDLIAGMDEATSSAHPRWLYQKLQRQWPEAAEQIIEANNGQPPMSLRVNARQICREDYLLKLAASGIEADPSPHSAEGIRLAQPVDVFLLPGFTEGEVSVQDEAAQMAAKLLGAEPGDRILDACSAPGGKACHILELQPAVAELIAADLDPLRLEKVAENLLRLKLVADLQTLDASNPSGTFEAASFDRILVDAPCSASGVIRRHPDVKVLRRPEDISQMADQQLDILIGLWPLLKPGGVLLYATCSIFDEENSQVVERFLGVQSDAHSHIPNGDWGEPTSLGRQFLPSANGPDGLYYALLGKEA